MNGGSGTFSGLSWVAVVQSDKQACQCKMEHMSFVEGGISSHVSKGYVFRDGNRVAK